MLLSLAVRTLQYYAIVLQSFWVEPNVELHWSMQPSRTLDLVRFQHLARRMLQVECLDIFQIWLLPLMWLLWRGAPARMPSSLQRCAKARARRQVVQISRIGRSSRRDVRAVRLGQALRSRDIVAESSGHRLGRWRRKCLQRCLLDCCNDVMRERAERWLKKECQNNAGSAMVGNAREVRNCEAVFTFLIRERCFLWVVGAECHRDAQEGSVAGCWMLGDPSGTCLGSVLWLSHERHVLRLVCSQDVSSSFSPFGELELAPWLQVVVGAPKGRRASSAPSSGQ